VAKATGDAEYTDDMVLPRMLYGKILRSPYPHARIIDIDTSRAENLPGVKAVITGKDTPGRKYGVFGRTADQYALAIDKVRYIGDEVAAVAAIDEDIVEEALDLIRVEYEPLPAVFDPEEAMRPGAPRIHGVERNISGITRLDFGDVERGFQESDYIREDRFQTGGQAHCQMEPHAALASFDSSGKLTIWVPNMSPFAKRRLLARTLNLPESNIRVCKSYVGGAFGGKSEMFSLDFCAALLSRKTGRPVKITYTREEVFITTRQRHPMIIELKTGVKKDGTIIARECRVIGDTGAYNSTGLLAVWISCQGIVKTYRVPNIRYEGYCVYTNKAICGAMRGHGSIQSRFADESQLDMIAEELGIDPLELRLKNVRQSGDILPNKSKVTSCALTECIQKTAESAGWKEKRGKLPGNRGIGMGCSTGYTSVTMSPLSSSAALVKFNEDGRVTLLTGAVENGQGTETMLAQIAAEELGLKLEDIVVASADSEMCPTDIGSYLMALTFVTGNAVKLAAAQAKRQLLETASEKLGADVADLEAKDGLINIKGSPEKAVSFRELVMASLMKGTPIMGEGHYMPQTEYLNIWTGEGKSTPTYSFSAQVAEVAVDRETGKVKLFGTSVAHDCGRAINPMDVEGQLEGAIAVSQGMALSEEVLWDEGQMLNPSFSDYRMPRFPDIPEITPIIVESIDPEGPFGGKEAGEGPAHTGPAAIANAIYDAIGVRIKETPITPESILKALDEKGRR
jgi:4-hydroxybenzoyl-CoA reductase subunit alpha